MEIIFLGTSAGMPTKERNVTAIAVIESKGRSWYLVDCGEGTQHQLLHTGLSLNHLKGIFITHIHGDHCYGLPGLLASASMNGRVEPLTIVAPKGIHQWYDATEKFTAFHLSYELNFISTEMLSDHALTLGRLSIKMTELSHRVPSYAYIFTENKVQIKLDTNKLAMSGIPKGPLWGQLQLGQNIEHAGKHYKSSEFTDVLHQPRSIIICGDNDNPDCLQNAYESCSVLIHEATFTENMADKAAKTGHSYAKQVAMFAEKQSITNLILTHFSPRYQANPESEYSIESIKHEAKSVYSGHLYTASDFDHYMLNQSGHIVLKN